MVLDKWMAEAILDKLDEFEGEIDDDFAYNLWERENIDGSVTYNAYEARKWIADYFEDLADYVEDYETTFGKIPNPFVNPEAFMVIMVIFITPYIVKDYTDKDELIAYLKEEYNV